MDALQERIMFTFIRTEHKFANPLTDLSRKMVSYNKDKGKATPVTGRESP
jgi:hypothetical protein